MILHMHGTTSAHLGLFHVNVDLVTQVGGRQARCCSLVAVKDHPQAVSKHMQSVIAVARARPAKRAWKDYSTASVAIASGHISHLHAE